MEKHIEVMKQSVDLSTTILDGLHHIQNLLGEGKFEETIYLFEDVIAAFASVEQSTAPVKNQLENPDIDSKSVNVQIALDLVVSSYEAKSYGKVQEIMQFTLIPHVKKWRVELENAFQPYLVS